MEIKLNDMAVQTEAVKGRIAIIVAVGRTDADLALGAGLPESPLSGDPLTLC